MKTKISGHRGSLNLPQRNTENYLTKSKMLSKAQTQQSQTTQIKKGQILTNSKISLKSIKNGSLDPSFLPFYSNFINLTYECIKKKYKINKNHTKAICNEQKNITTNKQLIFQIIDSYIEKWGNCITKHKENQHNNEEQNRQRMSIRSECLKQINRDIVRTQPYYPQFQKKQNLQKFGQTLVKYCTIDAEVGYVQGMNYLASPIIFYSKSSNQAFKLLFYIMNELELRKIYINNMQGAKYHSRNIVKLLKFKCHDLYKHLIELDLYMVGWILSLLGNIVPFEHYHLVIDLYIVNQWQGIYKFILVLILFIKDQLLSTILPDQILEILSTKNLIQKDIPWKQIYTLSDNLTMNLTHLCNS